MTPREERINRLIQTIHDASPSTTSAQELRDIRCAAKRLNRSDLLPRWMLYTTTPTPTPLPDPVACIQYLASPEIHDPAPILETKAHNAHIPSAALRAVYARELTNTAPLPPHLTRTSAAHARVNSFIRLAQGDSTARSDDADLLTLLAC